MTQQHDRVQEVDGVVRRMLAGGFAEVELQPGHCITAEISAKIKVRFAAVSPGDNVRCQISPVVMGKVRITDIIRAGR